MNLNQNEFAHFFSKVFAPTDNDKHIVLLMDLPNAKIPDTAAWQERRKITIEFHQRLLEIKQKFDFETVEIVYFENSGNNNADFPKRAYLHDTISANHSVADLEMDGAPVLFEEKLAAANIIFAALQFSATAPLKMLAKKYSFRAASMPGFNRKMLPALKLDFDKVHQQVVKIKERLDAAEAIKMNFLVGNEIYHFFVDTRHRKGNGSSGLVQEKGTAWNVPSGESYIVPYEGELDEPSKTSGILPVQFKDEVVLYKIENNRAFEILSQGPRAEEEARLLREEPAYGNIAEIGFGVLQPFGVKPIGVVLLDEKLGLHIAFGRSEHFGGATSPASFNNSANVVHIDRIYLPEMQDQITVKSVIFQFEDGSQEMILADNSYVI